MNVVRLLPAMAAMFFIACTPAPAPVETPKSDPTKEAWYAETLKQIAELNRAAESSFQKGATDHAAETITKAQPLIQRLLSVPSPTFDAMEAASDLDLLYGRMLVKNKHYGAARMLFQKDVARWRNWQPQSEAVVRRKNQAAAAMADCDRYLSN